jgi:hypothetical protein
MSLNPFSYAIESGGSDPSLKPDPRRKGSYYRRIEDIGLALRKLQIDERSETISFLVYYFGCEKLARGIVGIHSRLPAKTAYHHRKPLRLEEIKVAAAALDLAISKEELDWLFADFNQQNLLRSTHSDWTASARHLRNILSHDFGPSNVARIAEHAPFHNPRMKSFLECVPQILAYQKLHFSEVE